MDLIDQPGAVRQGEELDTERLAACLRENIPGISGDLTIKQFPGGFSNLTYLLCMGGREMVLRRPPIGKKAKTAHDMGREYRILRALHPVFPCCPAPVLHCEDLSVMGSPFFVMERIPGIVIRKDLPEGLSFTPDRLRRLFENVFDLLVDLHGVDYRAIGLEDFGRPAGYVERQVTGWIGRYRAARTADVPDFEGVMAWLQERMPPDTDRPAIIHNDYRLDNLVLDPEDPLRIRGILDWEMATLGDPLMDLGNALAYWVQKGDNDGMQAIRFMPTHLEGSPTREEIFRRYGEKTGLDVTGYPFYHCFGLFRLAVIVQQIYYRFFHGQTADQRFKRLAFAVQVLDYTAREVIEKAGA